MTLSFFLRSVRRNRWSLEFWDKFSWLKAGDIPVDPLFDILSQDEKGKLRNVVSMWYVLEDESNLNRIIAALAAARDRLDILDYMLVELELIEKYEFNRERTLGLTADERINNDWHFDIGKISGFNLLNFVKEILDRRRQYEEKRVKKDDIIRRVQVQQVKTLIQKALDEKWLDEEKINCKL